MEKIIDISEHNGNIDFNKVKQDGISGVIIRIGWIGNKENHTLDKKFNEYYKLAKSVNLKVGFYVYSYCRSVETLRNGINWLIDKIENKSFELPVFLDLEDNTIEDIGKENLTLHATQFCKIIENIGYKAGVYANKDWFTRLIDVNKLITYKIWLAEWNEKENHTANFKVDLWQYTSDARVNGINGRVDMNYCLNCQNSSNIIDTNNTGDFKMKNYQNGSTKETVYQDTKCQKVIGYLNPYEKAECYGIINNLALVVYNVDNSNYKKTGFVKWLNGVK